MSLFQVPLFALSGNLPIAPAPPTYGFMNTVTGEFDPIGEGRGRMIWEPGTGWVNTWELYCCQQMEREVMRRDREMRD